MALNDIGISFLEGSGQRKRQPDAGNNRLGGAVQMLALQLPRILGGQALAPDDLLTSLGSGGPQGLASVSPVGPGVGIAEAIADSVLVDLTRSGSPGVGTDLMSGLVPPPAPPRQLPGLPPRGGENPYALPPIIPSPSQPTPPVTTPGPSPVPLPVPRPDAPPPLVTFPSPTPSAPSMPEPSPAAPQESVEEILSRVRGYKDFMFGNG
jgi:hypothetical protein